MYKKIALIVFTVSALAWIHAYPQTKENIINVKPGKSFRIVLDSNRTTGYAWKLSAPIDKKIITSTGSKYIAPESRAKGAPGKEEWTFKAHKPGRVKLIFHYARPWEKNKPPASVREIEISIN